MKRHLPAVAIALLLACNVVLLMLLSRSSSEFSRAELHPAELPLNNKQTEPPRIFANGPVSCF